MTAQQALSRHGLAVIMSLVLIAVTTAQAEDKTGRVLATLERKFHGAWIGSGPCDGQLTLKADGTYERRHHGPAGNNSSGTWKVRWDALPPTLILSCKNSDDPAFTDKALEVKVIQLDDSALVFRYQQQRPQRYTPGKKQPAAGGEEDGLTKDDLLGSWKSVEITLTGGQSDLELKPDGKFIYEHLDVSLGWRTTITGTWELTGVRLVLTAQQRRHDGRVVAVGEKKTEVLSVTRRSGGGRILSDDKGLKLQQTTKGK